MTNELKKFGTALIYRQAGKEAFVAFQSSLEHIPDHEEITADFDGVITFSPSWGDEFLTPLLQRFGERFKLMQTDNPSVRTSVEILENSNCIRLTQQARCPSYPQWGDFALIGN